MEIMAPPRVISGIVKSVRKVNHIELEAMQDDDDNDIEIMDI